MAQRFQFRDKDLPEAERSDKVSIMVANKPKRARCDRQAFYTDCENITGYMVSRLKPRDTDVVWEPCAGKGVLIDAVRERAPNARIFATEIDPPEVALLRSKYSSLSNISIHQADAVLLSSEDLSKAVGSVNRIIANPPYGAWQSFSRRDNLKERFPGLYVKETYAVFLYHCTQHLAPAGRLVFILPDTFLWLHRHEFLRKTVFTQTTVEEIAVFPSKFFPGVDFGYSKLSIITLRKSLPTPKSNIVVLRDIEKPSVLGRIAQGRRSASGFSTVRVRQLDVANSEHCSLVLPVTGGVAAYAVDTECTLADIADIVTGFYSGNDRHWLRRATDNVRGAKNYQPIDPHRIAKLRPEQAPSLDGICDQRCFIPIVRGGSSPFVKLTLWYVDWSRGAVREYTRKGKGNPARFQNSGYYFRQGIGVPMVASAGVTGALLDNRLFDQGIVGVFPRDEKLLLFLLGFLNTRLATELLRSINPTANNSANYLKRIPFRISGDIDRCRVEEIVKRALKNLESGHRPPEETREELEDEVRRIWLK